MGNSYDANIFVLVAACFALPHCVLEIQGARLVGTKDNPNYVGPFMGGSDPEPFLAPMPPPSALPPNPSFPLNYDIQTLDSLFSLRFYQALNAQNQDGNLVFSPFSVLTILAALAEGARGETAAELYSATNRSLEWADRTRNRLAYSIDYLNQVAASPFAGYALTVANRMFVQKEAPLLQNFTTTLNHFYKMDLEPLDFSHSTAAEDRINAWVAEATRNQIPSLVPAGSVDLQTRLVLANAIYFKGEWDTMFNEENTRLRPFRVKKGRMVNVPTMSLQAELPYFDYPKLGFEMVELPYRGHNVSMFVVLPYEEQNLNAVTRRLLHRPFMLAYPNRRMYAHTVTVLLPKFKLEETADLRGVLYALGARRIFEQGRADLSGIADDDRELYVSDAFHKAAIEVNEKGTKAAAASAVVIKGRSMSSDPVFRADRPFLFFVRHNPSASILFMGRVKHLKDAGGNLVRRRLRTEHHRRIH